MWQHFGSQLEISPIRSALSYKMKKIRTAPYKKHRDHRTPRKLQDFLFLLLLFSWLFPWRWPGELFQSQVDPYFASLVSTNKWTQNYWERQGKNKGGGRVWGRNRTKKWIILDPLNIIRLRLNKLHLQQKGRSNLFGNLRQSTAWLRLSLNWQRSPSNSCCDTLRSSCLSLYNYMHETWFWEQLHTQSKMRNEKQKWNLRIRVWWPT